MEKRHRPRAGRSGAQRLKLVFTRLYLQPLDGRNVVLRQLAKQMAENRVQGIVLLHSDRYVYEAHKECRSAVLSEVETYGRRPAGDGTADVQQVGIALGTGAQDGIGEDGW